MDQSWMNSRVFFPGTHPPKKNFVANIFPMENDKKSNLIKFDVFSIFRWKNYIFLPPKKSKGREKSKSANRKQPKTSQIFYCSFLSKFKSWPSKPKARWIQRKKVLWQKEPVRQGLWQKDPRKEVLWQRNQETWVFDKRTQSKRFFDKRNLCYEKT